MLWARWQIVQVLVILTLPLHIFTVFYLFQDTHLHQVQALDAVLHFFDEFDFICRLQLRQLDCEVSLFLLGGRRLLLRSLFSQRTEAQHVFISASSVNV